MQIKTRNLTDAALNWMVAVCNGYDVKMWHTYRFLGTPKQEIVKKGVSIGERDEFGQLTYCPSGDWDDGGIIIENNKICITIDHSGIWLAFIQQNYDDEKRHMHSDKHPLIAAMRCYVSSLCGDIVEVPDELV